MANDEAGNKLSSNLKVPPLKIVLSSHQNNSFVNISSSLDDGQSKTNERDASSSENMESDSNSAPRRNGCDNVDSTPKHHRKSHRGLSETSDIDSSRVTARVNNFSPSSSSGSSDRSATNTPSSESESLASNSTIISENQSVKFRDDAKDETNTSKQERSSRLSYKTSSSERIGSSGTMTRKSAENSEPSGESNNHNSREHGHQSNQRITRSSQRAAQQSKTDLPGDTNHDEPACQDNQEKTQESSRKVKRRKGEPQESEQESAPTSTPTVILANICPADYQLPSQNSFELYRDIRKQPYTKLMKLSRVQPKAPHGFKDYLINGGPYLLDGNKLGLGLNGSKTENLASEQAKQVNQGSARLPLRMKLSNIHQRLSSQKANHNRHLSYTIPKPVDPPKSLQPNSGLYNLFVEQEKARQQMRLQHLKERERSILTAEQEILRVYKKAAMADVRQKVHLSACTFFYYQERYHYLIEKSSVNGGSAPKEVPHSQDNSNLCIEGGDAPAKTASANGETSQKESDQQTQSAPNSNDYDSKYKGHKKLPGGSQANSDPDLCKSRTAECSRSTNNESTDVSLQDAESEKGLKEDIAKDANDSTDSKKTEEYSSDKEMSPANRQQDTNENSTSEREKRAPDSEKLDNGVKSLDPDSDNYITDPYFKKEDPTRNMSYAELKSFNKELFLTQLQEIDDKWDEIKREMFKRHMNESDSLYAVQSLDWEWKSKEMGLCDVRVSMKIDLDLVPRVEVLGIDY